MIFLQVLFKFLQSDTIVHAQVGFGRDFQASRDIDNDVGRSFRLLGSFLQESIKRLGSPLRQFSRAAVRHKNTLSSS